MAKALEHLSDVVVLAYLLSLCHIKNFNSGPLQGRQDLGVCHASFKMELAACNHLHAGRHAPSIGIHCRDRRDASALATPAYKEQANHKKHTRTIRRQERRKRLT